MDLYVNINLIISFKIAIRTNRAYLLNGHYIISKMTTSVEFEGVRLHYTLVNPTKTHTDDFEIIKSLGQFSQNIFVQVRLLQSQVKP